MIEVLAGRDGRYRFTGVVPGGHWVQVFLEGKREVARTEPFDVTAGKAARRDFALETQVGR